MGRNMAYYIFLYSKKWNNQKIMGDLISKYELMKYENYLIDKLKTDKAKEKKIKELIEHSRFVAEIAFKLLDSKCNDLECYSKEILIASLLHDICKVKENEINKKQKKNDPKVSHAELAGDYIEQILSEDVNCKLISDIVRYHQEGNKDMCSSTNEPMCRIVYEADKISKVFKSDNWKEKKRSIRDSIHEEIKSKLNLPESKELYKELLEEIKFYDIEIN